ncbi:MAG: hypothetical protein M1814_003364 [Vezdaea aestivalis]|nr:MAG: hypothetical protein M1814_003364 [Vezdaea aestivalis]
MNPLDGGSPPDTSDSDDDLQDQDSDQDLYELDSESSEDLSDECQTLKKALYQSIFKVESAGSFTTFGAISDFVNPGISVAPVGLVRLPLSKEDAQALILESRKAPFGKGGETLVDESVRKTWEIDRKMVTFRNKKWQQCLDKIVAKATEALGIANGSQNVRAEFYKMLLYEEGAITEKALGMFGTLVVCLPAEHTGGDVCLQHEGTKKRFETSDSSEFGASFIAWYSDVFHEVEPVKSGCRWVLIYNLVNTSSLPQQTASVQHTRAQGFKKKLAKWRDKEEGTRAKCLIYKLEHQCTVEGLTLDRLKGNDYHRARFVTQNDINLGQYHVFLANLELAVLHDGDDYSEIENEEDFLSRGALSLTRVVDSEGHDLLIKSELSVTRSALLQSMSYESREPDVEKEGEYYGNESAQPDQFYKDSVMVIVPTQSVPRFLTNGNLDANSLELLVNRLLEISKSESQQSNSRDLLNRILRGSFHTAFNDSYSKTTFLGSCAVAAAHLRETSLFTSFISQMGPHLDSDTASALGEVMSFKTPIIPDTSCKRYWEALLRRIAEPALSNFDFTRFNYMVSYWASERYNPRMRNSIQGQFLTTGPLLQEFYNYLAAYQVSQPQRLLRKLWDSQDTHLIGNGLIRILKPLLTAVDVKCPEVQDYLQLLLKRYIVSSIGGLGEEPKRPTNWARPGEVIPICRANCKHCEKLADWLRDPNAQSLQLSDVAQRHATRLDRRLPYIQIPALRAKSQSIIIVKSFRGFETSHQAWINGVSRVKQALQDLPQAELQACLGHEYDDLINVRDAARYKIELDAQRLHGKHRPSWLLGSAENPIDLSQKRSLDEDSTSVKSRIEL